MLNRKSNDALARAGTGAAHSTRARKTPEILAARNRRIMASSFHGMTSTGSRANVMPCAPLFKSGRETPAHQADSSMLRRRARAAGPEDPGVLSFRGDTPAAESDACSRRAPAGLEAPVWTEPPALRTPVPRPLYWPGRL